MAPFIYPVDIRRWLDRGLKKILSMVCYTTSTRRRSVNNNDLDRCVGYDTCKDKLVNPITNKCILDDAGLCLFKVLEQQWTFRTKSKADKRCIWLDTSNKCRIYSVRPLSCRVYPPSGKCLNGVINPPSKHDQRELKQAVKEWKRASTRWRQDTLERMHEEIDSGVTIKDIYKFDRADYARKRAEDQTI